MSKETEDRLRRWEDDDTYYEDDIHVHFEQFDSWDWCRIADEGSRVYGIMFDEEVEEGSPISALHSGIAAAASNGMVAAFAKALGLEELPLLHAISAWYEKQDNPPPGGFDALMAEYRKGQEFLCELDAIKEARQSAPESDGSTPPQAD